MAAPPEHWSSLPLLTAVSECSTPLFGSDIGESEALKPWVDLIEQLLETESREEQDGKKKKSKFDLSKFFIDTAPSWITMIPLLGPSVGAAVEILGAGYDQMYLNKKIQGERHQKSATNQEQLFQQYINFLRKLSGKARLVLVLDDFHWADTSSTNLLFAAARQLAGEPILFVVAFRLDDAQSSRQGDGHPILHIRNELGRYSMCSELSVPKFGQTELHSLLLSRYAGYRSNEDFERWLIDVSGGNALFITQYLRSLEDDGVISHTTGSIDVKYESVKVPQSAYSVVQERIRRLSDEARDILRYASVEGPAFTSFVLAHLLDQPVLPVLQKLRNIREKNGDIESLGIQRVYTRATTVMQFTHRLLQKALYDGLEDEECGILHDRIITLLKGELEIAVREGTGVEPIAVRIASHAAAIYRHDEAASALLVAARSAWGHFAGDEAISMVRSILVYLDMNKTPRAVGRSEFETSVEINPDCLRADALLLRGKVYKLRAEYEKALADFETARGSYEKAGHSAGTADAMTRIAFTLENMGCYDKAEAASREALALAETLHDLKAQGAMLNNLGYILMKTGRRDEALSYQYRSLAVREECDDTTGQAVTLGSIGLLMFEDGKYDEALLYHERSLELRTASGDKHQQAFSLNNIGRVLHANGALDDALDQYGRSLEIRRDLGDRAGEAESLHNIGTVLSAMGRFDEALASLETSYAIRCDIHNKPLMAQSLYMCGMTLMEQGNIEGAAAKLKDAREIAAEARSAALLDSIDLALSRIIT
jgi:tetratricopeptide (TPR) repeat protein